MIRLLRIPRTVQNIQRFRQIASILAEYGFAEILIRMGLVNRWWIRIFRRGRVVSVSSMADRFVDVLERLGPSFVKLGQILSTRPDILPEEWIRALSRLQDEVAPLPFAHLESVIERATGPIDRSFAEFDRQPLASASVSQVHAARLADGSEVVVKVVRPTIRETVRNDIELMRIFAQLLEQRIAELRAFRPSGIVNEFERAITREMDLTREAKNIERFRANFSEDPRVKVPVVFGNVSDRNVLVMERIDGVRITDYHKVGNNPRVLARLGVEVIMKMAFEDGFFHADPHPGNVWTLPGNRLALLDMGMADFVLHETRDRIIDLMFATVTEDTDALVRSVLQLGVQPEQMDMQAFRRDLISLYEDHIRGADLSDADMGAMMSDSIEVARKHHIVIPTDITLLLKGLGTVEGIGKQLDPELNLVEAARPWVLKLVARRWGPRRIAKDAMTALSDTYALAMGLPRRVDDLIGRVERGGLRNRVAVEELSSSAERVESGGNRVAFALLVVALTVLGTQLLHAPVWRYHGVPVDAVMVLGTGGFLGLILLFGVWRSARRRGAKP